MATSMTGLFDFKIFKAKPATQPNEEPKINPYLDHTLTVPLGSEGLHHTRTTEVEHTLVIGSTGAGKTASFVRTALYWYSRHGEYKGIIYDFGGIVEEFYDPDKDIIINPFDARGFRINIFSMIKSREDCKAIADILIPTMPGAADPYFTLAPADLLASCLFYCHTNEMRENDFLVEVLNWTNEKARAELSTFWNCEHTDKYLSEAKLASTLSSIIGANTSILSFLPKGNDTFDAKEWIEGKNEVRWIFLTNNFKVSEVLAPWLNLFCWYVISTVTTVDEEDDMDSKRKNRLFLMLDEAPTLPSSVGKTIGMCTTNGRKFGISLWLLFQDIGQLRAKFGEDTGSSMLGSIKTRIFMMSGSDGKTSQYMSDTSGTQNRSHTKNNTGVGSKNVTFTDEMQLDAKLLAPAIFDNMRPFEAYIKLGYFGMCHTWAYPLQKSDRPKQPVFVRRAGLNMEVISAKYREHKAAYEAHCKHLKELDEAGNA